MQTHKQKNHQVHIYLKSCMRCFSNTLINVSSYSKSIQNALRVNRNMSCILEVGIKSLQNYRDTSFTHTNYINTLKFNSIKTNCAFQVHKCSNQVTKLF